MADKNLSRRDFIKSAGFMAGGLALSATGAWITIDQIATQSAVLDTIVNYDSNITFKQRKHKICEVLKKSALEPETFGSFIKFLALEVHANAQEYYTARDTIRNFLFGEGKALDITKSLSDSLRKEPGWIEGKFDRDFSSDREILQSLTKEIYEDSARLKKRDPSNTSVSSTTNKDGAFEAELVAQRGNTDTFYSLKKFNISVRGIKNALGITADCKLTDRYDWDGRISDAASLTYGQAADIAADYLDFIGIRQSKEDILKSLGVDEKSADQLVSIDDRDGLRLQNAGLGKPFEVYASWKVINMKVSTDLN